MAPDTLLKLAASKTNFTQTRKGRRPMRVDTLLRKEKEGTLYKHKLADAVGVQMVDGQKRVLDEEESQQMMAGIQQDLARITESLPTPNAIFQGLQGLFDPEAEEAKEAEAGTAETYLPWYGAALGGTGGALLGERVVPKKYRTAGMLGGALIGTGAGLHPAVALGRAIDKSREKEASAKKMVLAKGVEPVEEVRVRVRGADAGHSVMRLLENVHKRGRTGHSFGVYEADAEGKPAQGALLGGWDGDGGAMVTSMERVPLEQEKEAKAQRAAELLANLAKKKGIDPKNVGAIRQVENVAGSGQRGRAAEIALNVRDYLKAASAWAKLATSIEDVGEGLYPEPPKKEPKKFKEPVLSEVGEKTADSTKAQWLEIPYTEGERMMQNAPVLTKRKPGDMPTSDTDGSNGPHRYDPGQNPPDTAIPSKVAAALSKAISSTLIDDDPSDSPDRETPNPNRIQHQTDKHWFMGNMPDAAPITEVETDAAYKRAHVITPEEAYEVVQEVQELLGGAKVASADLDELYKEALFRRGRKLVDLGDEIVDLTPESGLSYRGLGRYLDELSKGFRPQKGVTPEDLAAVGADKGVAGRIFGEALHGAGHHMADASTIGIAANPLGKAIGGGIEGIARGSGKELQRAAGEAAQVGGGGVRGALGRGLERQAKRIGTVGEIGTGAATATALGSAISPMASGVGAMAKSLGIYGPLKGSVGALGTNVIKDTAAAALEEGAAIAPRAVRALRGATAAA